MGMPMCLILLPWFFFSFNSYFCSPSRFEYLVVVEYRVKFVLQRARLMPGYVSLFGGKLLPEELLFMKL